MMRVMIATLVGLLVLISVANDGFAQTGNQKGKGSQAFGSSSGFTGTTGNQGNDKPVGNAGGTRQ
jgi:hypothetical protein